MDFGLGLVLSFTDNATAGINNAVNSLNQLTQVAENAGNSLNEFASLSAFSSIAMSVGNSMTSMGTNIISTFGQIIGKVNETGQTLMYAENQLSKLYEGSGKTGKDVLADITQYAKTSIFEFENLIPVVTMLKANGIEAFDMIASSTGNANQTLMDYAADLAAFNPQMRNAYGTGIKAAMGALNEYIAEGNAMSLKRGASLDITGLLGEKKGATIEERSRQVADLMEQLNMVGMTAQLAQSPMTKLSNMSDTLFQFIGMISQSGVYDAFNDIIDVFSSFVMAIDDTTLQNVASIVGDALSALLKPIQQLAQWIVKLADGFIKLVENNPALAKFATIATAIAGVLLVVGGVALKFAGSIGYLTLMLKSLSTSFGAISTVMKAGATKIVGALVPVTLALGVMYLVWKNDLFGIRTLVTSFVQNVVNSFKTAKTAVSGSLADMQNTLRTFDTQNSFFDGLTLAIMRVKVLFQALAEGWNDYTLSEDTFLKAKELGILPLIEAILDLKYRFEFFKQGFLDGWKEIGDKVKAVIDGLLNNIDGTFLGDMLDRFTSFLQIFSGSDTQAWYDFGKSFAEFTAKAVAMFAVFNTAKKIISTISGISTVLKPLLGLVMAHPVVAIIVGVITALGILYAKSEKFRDLVNSVVGSIKNVIVAFLAEMLPLISSVVGQIKPFLPQLQSAFLQIASLLGGIIKKVMSLAMKLLPVITKVLDSIINTVISLLPTIMNVITTVINVLSEVFNVVSQLMDLVVPFIVDIANQLGSLISDILPVIADLISVVVDTTMNLVNTLLPIIQQIIQALMPVIKTILNIISVIVSKLVPVIKSVVSIVSNIIKAVISILVPIITVVMQIVEAIIVLLSPIVDVVLQIVGFITDLVLGIVQIVVSVVESIVAVITGIIEVVMSILNAIVQGIMTVVGYIVGIVTVIIETITSIISAIVGVVQGIWDSICNVFSNAVSFFSGIFTSISTVISNVFNGIASFFNTVWDKVVTTFTTLGDTISDTIKSAINTVVGGAVNIINGFIKAINLAIGAINAIPGVSITKLTELNVPALAQGGVVDKPTTALIGEAGTEAVMPLENNTQWIGKLATMISTQMENIRPTNTSQMNTTNNEDTTNKYLTTNNNTNNQTIQGDTDNSINFHEGAIQVTVQNASEEEAMRLAKMIMEYIKRQKQLDRMMNYA